MSKFDSAQRFLFADANIRGELVHLSDSFVTIMQQRNYPQFVQQFLGEVLVAAVLLASTIKFEGELTIQLATDGPINMLVAKCSNTLDIRGLVNWQQEAAAVDLVAALGQGKLVITVTPKKKTGYYQSIVPLAHRSVAAAIEHYFAQSEQLTTRLWLAVGARGAAGMLLQLLPDADTEEGQAYWQHLVTLANTTTRQELIGLDNFTLLRRLYHEEVLRVFDHRPVRFRCTCTVARMEGAILAMGEQESQLLLSTNKEIAVTCEYCNHSFVFDKVDVAQIFASKPDDKMH